MRLLAALGGAALAYLLSGSMLGLMPTRLSDRSSVLDTARARRTALQNWLLQADAPVTIMGLAARSAGFGLLGGLVTFFFVPVVPLAIVGGAMTGSVPTLVLVRRRRRLVQDRLAGWPDAIRDLITQLRSGHSLHAGLCQVAQTGPEPLRPFFIRYVRLAGPLGQKPALEVVREELAHPFSDRIIEIMLVASDQGSSIILDVFEDLARATSDDLRLTEEIETAQLENKLEARGAALLPFAVLLLLCSTSDDYRAFYQTSVGWSVVLLGAGLSSAGLLIIGRLGHLPVEPRIVAGGES